MTEDTDASDPAEPTSTSDADAVEDGPSRLDTKPTPACDRCERTHPSGRTEIRVGESRYAVCDRCLRTLVAFLERYHWWEWLTEAHYDRAAAFLRSLEEVWCVKDHAYAGGELWVHTPYCDAAVVRDVCDHFGFRIRWFSVVTPGDGGFECVAEHGPCIEINLVYTNRISTPFPLEYDIRDDVTYYEVEWLDDEARLFGPRD